MEALERSPDAVFITDRQNRIVGWNPAAERTLGYSTGEAVDKGCAGLLEGCDTWGNRYCSENCPIREMAGRGEPVRHFDLRLRLKGQGTVAVDMTILHLAVPPPNHFYLVHVLKPKAAARPDEGPAAAPSSGLVAARDSQDARARRLTAREVEILGLMAAGRMTGEIASSLNLSTLTVRNHTQNILDKLEVHSKAEAIAFAFQKRLV
jgi:DNA-binding CsgD family transcriptional regulator